ncbi:urea transporter [Rhizophagus clarus]|uniref:Urea transporter n=1 Tax=Rhizophagus clarus TaxID=94130 RepID=A0A8H3L201_9GLOM|nr:urea transporter [Rhizophagus clarus]
MLPAVVSNVLIYLVLAIFLGIGFYAGYKKTKDKSDYLSALGTQNAISLGSNWFASSIGSSILYAYPEVGTIAGLLGVIMYAFGSIVPLFVFAWLGPLIRNKCPKGFTLTQFVLERFGRVNQIYVSLMSIAYMFCYMISELSAVGDILVSLTGVNKFAPVICIAVVTTLYTGYGGLRASLITDNIQGWAIILLVILSIIGLGTSIRIDKSVIDNSPLLKSNSIGWQLLYIMPVAVTFATLFHEGFWQRTFASKNDRELRLSVVYGSIILFPVLVFLGFTGVIAAWSGLWPGEDDTAGYLAFFTLFKVLPEWVRGITVVLTVSMSCAAYDTLISAITAILSNDIFNNRLPLNVIRLLSLIVNVPAVYWGLTELDVLRVFLIGDLLAASTMPPILLGLYIDDYSVLGAFIVAPFSSIFFTFLSFVVRLSIMWVFAKIRGKEFVFPKKPEVVDTMKYAGDAFKDGATTKSSDPEEVEIRE